MTGTYYLLTYGTTGLLKEVYSNVQCTPPRGPVLGYVLEAGSAEGRTDVGVFPIGGSVTTLPVPNVPPGTYYIRRAMNAQGTGLPSYDTTLIVP